MLDKTYIFLTFAIFGIGGTQIYLRNKINYLRSRGWNICVITIEPGEKIYIQELGPFREGVFPELAYNPYLFTKSQRNNILKNVENYIKKFGDVNKELIIESNFIGIAPWGELIAEHLKAKHIILFIQEDYRFKVESYRKFFEFKLNRGELAANSSKALETLFEGYLQISNCKQNQLSAYCANSIEDCDSKINLPKADFYICSFGRINKPFVMPMIDTLIEYVERYPDINFHLVLLGWTDNKDHITTIANKIKSASNLSYQATGPIYPVSRKDLMKMDVFISTAGAAWSTFNEGLLTISIDDTDYLPIGIMGHTTKNSLHRDNEPPQELGKLLDEILIKRKYSHEYKIVASAERIYTPKFDQHIKFLAGSNKTAQYYSIKKLRPKLLSRVYFIITTMLKQRP